MIIYVMSLLNHSMWALNKSDCPILHIYFQLLYNEDYTFFENVTFQYFLIAKLL